MFENVVTKGWLRRKQPRARGAKARSKNPVWIEEALKRDFHSPMDESDDLPSDVHEPSVLTRGSEDLKRFVKDWLPDPLADLPQQAPQPPCRGDRCHRS